MEQGMSFKNGSKGETTLERVGREARNAHLKRNEWIRNYMEYTRMLVNSEYEIQQEFKVS